MLETKSLCCHPESHLLIFQALAQYFAYSRFLKDQRVACLFSFLPWNKILRYWYRHSPRPYRPRPYPKQLTTH